MKIGIFLLILSFWVTVLPALDNFRLGGGYSPGVTVLRSRASGSDNNKDRDMPMGVVLDFSFAITERLGFGSDLSLALTSSITVSDDDSTVTLNNWSGVLSYVNFSMYLYFMPRMNNPANFKFGLGPSFTTKLYFSEYATAFGESYLGLSLKFQFAIPVSTKLDLTIGGRASLDSFGFWNAELIQDFSQIHFFPSITMVYKL